MFSTVGISILSIYSATKNILIGLEALLCKLTKVDYISIITIDKKKIFLAIFYLWINMFF